MYWIMPCTYMETHGRAHTPAHTHCHICVRARVCTHAHICTHRGTSVQRTPSILNPDPGLVSVFTCKWSTTICGPSRLLCPSSRLGLGKRAASQMGVGGVWEGGTSDGLPWLWSQTLGRERGKRLPAWQPLKQQGLPHIMAAVHGSGSFSDWRAGGAMQRTEREAFLPEV